MNSEKKRLCNMLEALVIVRFGVEVLDQLRELAKDENGEVTADDLFHLVEGK